MSVPLVSRKYPRSLLSICQAVFSLFLPDPSSLTFCKHFPIQLPQLELPFSGVEDKAGRARKKELVGQTLQLI